jgi:cysteinyl-tRNA synthetase
MTEIRLYNTVTRRKEPLEPTVTPGKVGMYVCGPTVYDRAHIGNARPVVVFDVLFRLLRHVYGDANVTYVRNITDVDDKINARAAATRGPGESELQAIARITAETTRWFHEDMDALGALRPTHEPRATEYVGQMVAMIATLIARGHAYAAEGHVLFSVSSYPEYGKLARRSLDEMRAGARVEVAPYKRDPMDFVLWKPSDADTPGWDSPWGRGRPGWHIECSAMAHELLGASFDIHGGGIDLAFPHHENEVAQSRCAHPEGRFARIWMHNGFLNVEGEKMSKSLGNFFTVRELLEGATPMHGGKQSGEEIRMALLLSNYREPIDFGVARRHEARAVVTDFAQRLGSAGISVLRDLMPSNPLPEVVDALSDDLDTNTAIRCLQRRALLDRYGASGVKDRLPEILASQMLLGFDLRKSPTAQDAARQRDSTTKAILEEAFPDDEASRRVRALLDERKLARTNRDFARADAIRKQLIEAGVRLMDRPGADTEWERGPDFDPAKLEALQ